MESFLKNRKQSAPVRMPEPQKGKGLDLVNELEKRHKSAGEHHAGAEQKTGQEVKTLSVPEGVLNAPKVEMVVEEGTVRKICITCDNGQYIELECLYDDVQ